MRRRRKVSWKMKWGDVCVVFLGAAVVVVLVSCWEVGIVVGVGSDVNMVSSVAVLSIVFVRERRARWEFMLWL